MHGPAAEGSRRLPQSTRSGPSLSHSGQSPQPLRGPGAERSKLWLHLGVGLNRRFPPTPPWLRPPELLFNHSPAGPLPRLPSCCRPASHHLSTHPLSTPGFGGAPESSVTATFRWPDHLQPLGIGGQVWPVRLPPPHLFQLHWPPSGLCAPAYPFLGLMDPYFSAKAPSPPHNPMQPYVLALRQLLSPLLGSSPLHFGR